MKLLIAIPSNRDWKQEFALSLLQLALHLTKFPEIEATISAKKNISVLSAGRQEAIFQAIRENHTHVLCLDDDMKFTPEAFDLLKNKDKDFVAANYLRKDGIPVSRGKKGENDVEPVYSKGKNGIERVVFAGLGFCLIRVSSFKDIPAPHFEVKWNPHIQYYCGEDTEFCFLLSKHGIKIYVDHDSSKHVQHIGDFYHHEN